MIRQLFLLCAWMIPAFCCASGTNDSQLSDLLKSKTPCRVHLQPEWIGQANYTVQTGYFKNAPSQNLENETNLHFNLFNKWEKPTVWNEGPMTICDSLGHDTLSEIHTFRSSLPLDPKILTATNLASLEKLLGKSQIPSDTWGGLEGEVHTIAGWRFFTMNIPDNLETLHIFCMLTQRRGESDAQVDSLKILRGTAKPK